MTDGNTTARENNEKEVQDPYTSTIMTGFYFLFIKKIIDSAYITIFLLWCTTGPCQMKETQTHETKR